MRRSEPRPQENPPRARMSPKTEDRFAAQFDEEIDGDAGAPKDWFSDEHHGGGSNSLLPVHRGVRPLFRTDLRSLYRAEPPGGEMHTP